MSNKVKSKSLKDLKSFDKEPSWDEQLDPVVFSRAYQNKNKKIRLCAPFTPVGAHYVLTKPSDMGKPFPERTGKSFVVWCPDFDSETEVSSAETCDCCKLLSDKNHLGKIKVYYYTQGFIESTDKKGRKSWGEMQTIVLEAGAISAIKNIYETSGNGIDPQDRKNGYAIWLKYDNSVKPVKWLASKAEDIPLKDIDGYSKDDLVDFSEYFKPTDAKAIKESLKRLGYYEFLEKEDSDEENDFDDDDEKPKKKKKKHDDDDDSSSDDEEDEKPKKKKKKYDDDDSSDDDDDDSSSDDEDEKPKKKKKKHDDDDDDSSDDDDDDSSSDDEEDEKPKKKKKNRDDDDNDDDDEDEKPKKKKKKYDDDDDSSSDDDDDSSSDDDDDDSSSDDDEEDEKPKKKKKKKHDDDDDDDDEKPKKKKKKYDWDD